MYGLLGVNGLGGLGRLLHQALKDSPAQIDAKIHVEDSCARVPAKGSPTRGRPPRPFRRLSLEVVRISHFFKETSFTKGIY
jgi:hypothetical protein